MKFEDLEQGQKFYLTSLQAEGTGHQAFRLWEKLSIQAVGVAGTAIHIGLGGEPVYGIFQPEQEVTLFRQQWQRWSDTR